jgi:hypothetical protein
VIVDRKKHFYQIIHGEDFDGSKDSDEDDSNAVGEEVTAKRLKRLSKGVMVHKGTVCKGTEWWMMILILWIQIATNQRPGRSFSYKLHNKPNLMQFKSSSCRIFLI